MRCVGFQLPPPTGAGGPDACAPPDPLPRSREEVELRVGAHGLPESRATPSRSAGVRSQPGWAAGAMLGHREAGGPIVREPPDVHTLAVDRRRPQAVVHSPFARCRRLEDRHMFPRLLLVLVVLLAVPIGAARGAAAAVTEQPDPVGVWPLEPEPPVALGFDPPEHDWGSGHRGVDLRGTAAQVVVSALPGTVTFAGVIGGKRVVVVDHGSTRTTYEPVAPLVDVGQVVEAGDPLGWLMVPFSHCYPAACLHWGWRRGEDYLDPLALVGADGQVRLLPLWRDRPVTPWGAPVGRPGGAGPW